NRVGLTTAIDRVFEVRVSRWPRRIDAAFSRGDKETVERLLIEYDEAKAELGVTEDDPKVVQVRNDLENLPSNELSTLLGKYPQVAVRLEGFLQATGKSEQQD